MRSFATQRSWRDLLSHNERNPSLARPWHPIVRLFNFGYIPILVGLYLLSDRNLGQTIAFMAGINLYLSSTAYHTWKPKKSKPLLRTIDQIAIGWFIPATPLPFVYDEPAKVVVLGILMGLTALSKCYRWEQDYLTEAMVFFVIGAFSYIMTVNAMMSKLDVDLISTPVLLITLATGFYVGKLTVYTLQKGWVIKNVWGAPETGHLLCSVAMTLYYSAVVIYPV